MLISTEDFSHLYSQYVPGFDNAYITWISNNKASWTINAAGVGADETVNISARPVPQEPMVSWLSSTVFSAGLTQSIIVLDHEPGHLRELRHSRRRESQVPGTHDGRLDQSLPTTQRPERRSK